MHANTESAPVETDAQADETPTEEVDLTSIFALFDVLLDVIDDFG